MEKLSALEPRYTVLCPERSLFDVQNGAWFVETIRASGQVIRANRPLSWFASKPLPSNGHNLELSQANMPRIGPPPRGAMGAENVSDLQLVPGLQPRVLLEPPS